MSRPCRTAKAQAALLTWIPSSRCCARQAVRTRHRLPRFGARGISRRPQDCCTYLPLPLSGMSVRAFPPTPCLIRARPLRAGHRSTCSIAFSVISACIPRHCRGSVRPFPLTPMLALSGSGVALSCITEIAFMPIHRALMRASRSRNAAACVIAVAMVWCSMAAAQDSGGLTFRQALDAAVQRAPMVAAKRAAAEGAAAARTSADRLPDPRLNVGVENVPIERRGALQPHRRLHDHEQGGLDAGGAQPRTSARRRAEVGGSAGRSRAGAP